MDKKILAAIAGVSGLSVGYGIGNYKWSNKKTQRALDQLITLGNLFADTLKWVAEEGIQMEQNDFALQLEERLTYIEIVANET